MQARKRATTLAAALVAAVGWAGTGHTADQGTLRIDGHNYTYGGGCRGVECTWQLNAMAPIADARYDVGVVALERSQGEKATEICTVAFSMNRNSSEERSSERRCDQRVDARMVRGAFRQVARLLRTKKSAAEITLDAENLKRREEVETEFDAWVQEQGGMATINGWADPEEEAAALQRLLEMQPSAEEMRARQEYGAQIRDKIARSWQRLDGTPANAVWHIAFRQLRDGTVAEVRMVEGTGNTDIDQSVEAAVWAASPMPLPRDSALFDHGIELMLEARQMANWQ